MAQRTPLIVAAGELQQLASGDTLLLGADPGAALEAATKNYVDTHGGDSTLGITRIGNTAYTILSTDRAVVTNATFTTTNTWLLPTAASVPAGRVINVYDLVGGVSSSNFLQIGRQSSDTIEPGALTAVAIQTPKGGMSFQSDGTNKWYVIAFEPGTAANAKFPFYSNSGWQISPYAMPGTVGTNGSIVQSNGSNMITTAATYATAGVQAGYLLRDSGTGFASYPTILVASSVATVSAGYAADTYLAGSMIPIQSTDAKAQGQYYCIFDMAKTGAGVAGIVLSFRMGTAGTTADPVIVSQTYAAGTAVVDSGIFEVWITFRTVGSGTSAVVVMNTRISKTLTTTGLINSTNIELLTLGTVSAGFASTGSTRMGLSFNGGSAFAGTNTYVNTRLTQP